MKMTLAMKAAISTPGATEVMGQGFDRSLGASALEGAAHRRDLTTLLGALALTGVRAMPGSHSSRRLVDDLAGR
jgi:hypothetical protein